MRRWLLPTLLALSACRNGPPPGVYRSPDGAFEAAVPGHWKVDESPRPNHRVTFFGPGMTMIAASFKEGQSPSAVILGELAFSGGPPVPVLPDGPPLDVSFERALPNIHGGPARERRRAVALEAKGGTWLLEFAWPLDAPADPAFEAFKASFHPLKTFVK